MDDYEILFQEDIENPVEPGDDEEEIDEFANNLEHEIVRSYWGNVRGSVRAEVNTTPSYMNPFEKARVIGMRAEAIDNGADILINMDDYPDLKRLYDPIRIATQELEENVLNMIIRRYLPNGTYEERNVQELELLG